MPQTTRRGVAPLNLQPRWPEGFLTVLREAGAQEKNIPHWAPVGWRCVNGDAGCVNGDILYCSCQEKSYPQKSL